MQNSENNFAKWDLLQTATFQTLNNSRSKEGKQLEMTLRNKIK